MVPRLDAGPDRVSNELVAEVGLGHPGRVLALEVSRFACSSADWYQPLDLSPMTGTLIADAHRVCRRRTSTAHTRMAGLSDKPEKRGEHHQ